MKRLFMLAMSAALLCTTTASAGERLLLTDVQRYFRSIERVAPIPTDLTPSLFCYCPDEFNSVGHLMPYATQDEEGRVYLLLTCAIPLFELSGALIPDRFARTCNSFQLLPVKGK